MAAPIDLNTYWQQESSIDSTVDLDARRRAALAEVDNARYAGNYKEFLQR